MNNFFEFHCHTSYSEDGGAKIKNLIEICRKSGVSGIAITDHDKIDGALALKKMAPQNLNIVIGEEINTIQGEIIGLYLDEKINSELSLKKTIQKIKEQGGLVIIPHPFDRLRSKRLPLEEIKNNLAEIDIIETFNARCVFSEDNEKAEEFAKKNNKLAISGSDAHFIGEYGKTLIKNINCQDPQNFLESLKKASFQTHKASIFFHFLTKFKKLTNGNER